MSDPKLPFKEIHPDTLQQWLAENKPVTVVDIRPKNDYEDWHIAEAINVDSYEALHFQQAGELAAFDPEPNVPVVTVCYSGQTSKLAAFYLASKGVEAYSLTGGMQWWSTAWNQAEIPLKKSRAHVIQVRRTGKGCLSYLIGSGGKAAVIDPSVAPKIYLDVAADHSWTIENVIETHIHADHLTRGRLLAEEAGAAYLIPETDRTHFEHETIENGGEIKIGNSRLQVIATPGHTFESLSYLLDEEIFFTGDTLFPTSIGRSDLKTTSEELKKRAAALFQSLQKLKEWDGSLLIAACHTSQPVAFLSEAVCTTLQEALAANQQFLDMSQETFIQRTTENIPPTPPNHLNIINFNEQGIFPQGDVTILEAGANNCAL